MTSDPTVAFVVAHYREANVSTTLELVQSVRERVADIGCVCVANQEPAHRRLVATAAAWTRPATAPQVLRHDNAGAEFGAYQAGIDRVMAQVDPDWLIVANDTWGTHGNFARVFRDRLLAELRNVRDFPVTIGRVHALARSYALHGVRSNRWVQTHFFALNRAALRSLDCRVFFPSLDALVRGSSEPATFFDDAMDSVLRDHLEVWLFRTRPGPQWYAAEPLEAANADRMARKARSILYEKYLSAALDTKSCEFVNLNELSFKKKTLRTLDDEWFDFKRRFVRRS